MNEPKSKAQKTITEAEAVTTPAKPAQMTTKDVNHGRGGAYEIRNGQRVLVQRTHRKD